MEKGIIRLYDEESKEKLNQDSMVKCFKEDLEIHRICLMNLRINYSTAFRRLLHPIKTIRIKRQLKRVLETESKLNELLDSSLVMHFDEESGVLEEDLENASRYYKPKHVKKFIRENKWVLAEKIPEK